MSGHPGHPTARAPGRFAPVRLVIADDNDAYRAGMIRAADLHPDIDLVAEAESGLDAVAAVVRHRPDVALIDLRMPGVDGFAVCRRLAAADPPLAVRVVILSAAIDDAVREEVLAAGAAGFLTKDLPRTDILHRLVEIGAQRTA